MHRVGRTTRLLEDAIRLAKEGRAVYIVAANNDHILTLLDMFDDLSELSAQELGVKFETASSLSTFDLFEMRLKNAHSNCVVLVDHFAIETRFQKVLEMLHRYDPKNPSAEIEVDRLQDRLNQVQRLNRMLQDEIAALTLNTPKPLTETDVREALELGERARKSAEVMVAPPHLRC